MEKAFRPIPLEQLARWLFRQLDAGGPVLGLPRVNFAAAACPFWGSRVAALGVGPTPIPRAPHAEAAGKRASPDGGGRGDARARAAALGALIRAEDGVAEAVEHFGQMALARSEHLID